MTRVRAGTPPPPRARAVPARIARSPRCRSSTAHRAQDRRRGELRGALWKAELLAAAAPRCWSWLAREGESEKFEAPPRSPSNGAAGLPPTSKAPLGRRRPGSAEEGGFSSPRRGRRGAGQRHRPDRALRRPVRNHRLARPSSSPSRPAVRRRWGQSIRARIEAVCRFASPPGRRRRRPCGRASRSGEELRDRRAFWSVSSSAPGRRRARRAESLFEPRPAGRAGDPGRRRSGDPELLTLKAWRALQSATIILYDDLVGPEILELARREAKRVAVGKTGRGPS